MKKIVIIGGGIVGASAAYELIRKSVDITLIDSHKQGRATSAAAGIICPWMTQRRNKAWYSLARNGALYYHQFIPALQADGEMETGYKNVGMIRLAKTIEALEKFRLLAETRREKTPEIGDITILNPQETKEKFPYITDDYYSLYIEGAARVDGRLLRDAFIRASQKRGAKYIQAEAELIEQNGTVIGVHTGKETIYADKVIVANGIWMPELFEKIGLALDVKAQKGQIIDLESSYDTDLFPVVKPPNNQYMLCSADGHIIIGATQDHTTNFLPTVSAAGMHYILEEAFKYAPNLAQSDINEIRVGFRPITYNHAPMFGEIPFMQNVLIATGLGASGLNTGPYMGKQLALLAVDEPTDIDITPYRPDMIVSKLM